MAPVLDIIHRLVIQNLVGLRGIFRARRFIDPFLLMKDLRIAPGRAQQKQASYREQSTPLYGRQNRRTEQTSPLSNLRSPQRSAESLRRFPTQAVRNAQLYPERMAT